MTSNTPLNSTIEMNSSTMTMPLHASPVPVASAASVTTPATALSVAGSLASPSITALAFALAKAQGTMGVAQRNASNSTFGSTYADLSAIIAAIGDSLSSNGLSFFQRAHVIPGHIAIETLIIHETGEFLSAGVLSVPIQGSMNIQDHGAAITYVRRYALQSALGIATAEDDGNAAAAAAKPNAGIVTVKTTAPAAPATSPVVAVVSAPVEVAVSAPAPAPAPVVASAPVVTPAAPPVATLASASADSSDPEGKDLLAKILFVNGLADKNRLASAKLRAADFFKSPENRAKFVAAIDARVTVLNASVPQAA